MRLRFQHYIACLIGAIALSVQGHVAASGCNTAVAKPPALMHQNGSFLLHYALEGNNALSDPRDSNSNGVPDIVEDTSLQLQVMHELLMHFGFSNPLALDRYAGQGAKVVHVRFVDMKGNGTAMDEPRTPRGQPCGLLINLSTKLSQGNLTPAHEYFHLLQYAYAPYKRSWYLEGMARWSETLLGRDVSFGSPANKTRKVQPAEVFEMSYNAYSSYWQAFAQGSKLPPEHDLPRNLVQARYTNGDVVLKDNRIWGIDRMKAALEALREQGLVDSKRLGLDPAAWPESLQRDPVHDEVIWNVLQQL